MASVPRFLARARATASTFGGSSRPQTGGIHSSHTCLAFDPHLPSTTALLTPRCVDDDAAHDVLGCCVHTLLQGYFRVYCGPATAHKVTRLRPGQTYQLRVQCSNVKGMSEPSLPITLTTAPSVPATPQAPDVLATTSDSATLRWTSPAGNGEPVSSYMLEGDYGDGGALHLVYSGPAEECCVTRLEVRGASAFVWCMVCVLWGCFDTMVLLFRMVLRVAVLVQQYV